MAIFKLKSKTFAWTFGAKTLWKGLQGIGAKAGLAKNVAPEIANASLGKSIGRVAKGGLGLAATGGAIYGGYKVGGDTIGDAFNGKMGQSNTDGKDY